MYEDSFMQIRQELTEKRLAFTALAAVRALPCPDCPMSTTAVLSAARKGLASPCFLAVEL